MLDEATPDRTTLDRIQTNADQKNADRVPQNHRTKPDRPQVNHLVALASNPYGRRSWDATLSTTLSRAVRASPEPVGLTLPEVPFSGLSITQVQLAIMQRARLTAA